MKITTTRFWHSMDVRNACIENDLYTCGDNSEYEEMLDMVRNLEPTMENLYAVAKNICDHSKHQTITNVMFILENNVVKTCFEIDGRVDI